MILGFLLIDYTSTVSGDLLSSVVVDKESSEDGRFLFSIAWIKNVRMMADFCFHLHDVREEVIKNKKMNDGRPTTSLCQSVNSDGVVLFLYY